DAQGGLRVVLSQLQQRPSRGHHAAWFIQRADDQKLFNRRGGRFDFADKMLRRNAWMNDFAVADSEAGLFRCLLERPAAEVKPVESERRTRLGLNVREELRRTGNFRNA